MEITEVLSWIGSATGVAIGLPQIAKTILTKSVSDVSTLSFVLILITASCFVGRAIAIREIAFVVYYLFIILSASFQLFLIWRYSPNRQVAQE
jgi:uncharacterized protein with PQ loop repeat